MKKIILKNILYGSAIALVIMAIMVFLFEFSISKGDAAETASVRLDDAVTKLETSKLTISELTEQLDAEYISKANAFAEMIKLNPSIIDDAVELEKIREMLEVDELHVTDDKAVIWWGTIPDYFGFDFSTSEQTKPFLPILNDDTLEIAQEAMPNGAEGKLFQYISVPRRDSKGIVQIGMAPHRLIEALANNQPDVVLGSVSVGTNGSLFAINKADMTIAAIYDTSFLGLTAEEAGITEAVLSISEGAIKKAKICGSSFYVSIRETDEYYLGAIIPENEVVNKSITTTVVVFLFALIVILLLAYLVNCAVSVNIINEINKIQNTMTDIKNGNNELRVDVRSCEELSVLSDDINGMLDSINVKISETQELNGSMEVLLEKISDVSQSINSYSGEMQDVSKRISEGSSSQAATVQELSATFTAISKEVNDNAAAAQDANRISAETTEQLKTSTEKMSQMQNSMQQISAVSQKINNIVKTIDDIAFQTNILALNAAVEAARAGAAGKGFAVVADEVRNLANKSAEAAQGTTLLINETIEAVNHGASIADEAAAELTEVMESVTKSTDIIAKIAQATVKQAKSIDEAVSGMTQISEVVQVNSGISFNAQDTASKLDLEAGKLIDMVASKQ